MNYLRAKNENLAKKRPFCEKIYSLGWYFDIALFDFESEKYFISKLIRVDFLVECNQKSKHSILRPLGLFFSDFLLLNTMNGFLKKKIALYKPLKKYLRVLKWRACSSQYIFSLFSVFPYLNHSLFAEKNARAQSNNFTDFFHFFHLCTNLLYKLSTWPSEDQLMKTCDYLKG